MIKINIKKNKLLAILCIVFFIAGSIIIYMNNNLKTDFVLNNDGENDHTLSETNNCKKNSEGTNSDDTANKEDFIYVHIAGEVNNPGIVKLHERCKNN